MLTCLLGPQGPFTNIPPTLETHVEFIASTIKHAESNNQKGTAVVEATAEAEAEWTNVCDEMSKLSLFRQTDSWIFGANVPGKRYANMFFFGGLADYKRRLQEVVEDGYKGFKPF